MIKRSIPVLLSALLLIGCQSAPEQAEAEEGVEDVAVSLRPDPQNPKGENNTVPEDWHVRLDRPNPDAIIGANADSSDIYFVSMIPGWHITTGPAGIFYHPHSTAEGNYEASVAVHLSNPGERMEAFGMIIGGKDLDGEAQTYDYFLIRNSGEFLIKRRTGEETSLIQDWTASDAIVRYTDPKASAVLNNFAVKVGADNVAFVINDVEVASHPRADIQTDGLVGIRVNHALNLHISDLAVNEKG